MKTHTLETARRTVTLKITEHPDRISFDLRLSEYGDFEDSAEISRWLLPLLEAYDDDPRPNEMVN